MLFCLSACRAESHDQTYVSDSSAADAIAKADAAARLVHLPGDLEEAGANPKKIARVYIDAQELGSESIKTQADARLSTIMLPRAEAAKWEGTITKLLKIAPEGSQTAQRIKLIASKKHYQ
jgi:hypothetical protein